MILGMSLETFTFVHVVISLVGIMTGLIVVALMLSSAPIAGWNAFFLVSTILTSITGYFFPFTKGLTPAHIVGAISLVILAVALFALYGRKLAGPWRAIYVATAVAALWLNFFVAIVQSFAKFAYLNKFAPTGSELPFASRRASSSSSSSSWASPPFAATIRSTDRDGGDDSAAWLAECNAAADDSGADIDA